MKKKLTPEQIELTKIIAAELITEAIVNGELPGRKPAASPSAKKPPRCESCGEGGTLKMCMYERRFLCNECSEIWEV